MALVHRVTVTFTFEDGDDASSFSNGVQDEEFDIDDLPEWDEAVVDKYTTEEAN